MIAPKIAAEVRRLLMEGELSQRQIAQLTGVSRGTVGSIASGKRPDYDALRQSQENEWEEPLGPPERCPGCGGKVYMPCRLCHARQNGGNAARQPPKGRAVTFDERVRLDLRPDHRARYEEVRAWRKQVSSLACGRGEDFPGRCTVGR